MEMQKTEDICGECGSQFEAFSVNSALWLTDGMKIITKKGQQRECLPVLFYSSASVYLYDVTDFVSYKRGP